MIIKNKYIVNTTVLKGSPHGEQKARPKRSVHLGIEEKLK
jgi:hypothetical protein